MKVGDKVKVIKNKSPSYGRVGIVKAINEEGILVRFENGGGFYLDTELECQVIHLDLSLEDMNALAELWKMKDNLELLERLLKRAKG